MASRMRLLVGYDGSECAESAIRDLRRAGMRDDVEAVVMTCVDLTPHLPRSCYEPVDPETAAKEPQIIRNARTLALAAIGEARLTAARGVEHVRAEFPKWDVRSEVTPDYAPYRALVVKAEQWRPDLLVVGSHGRSAAGRALLGSVSQQVLGHAVCSVRIARFREHPDRLDGDGVRLVLGIDGSIDSAAAADAVAARAWPKGSEVRVVLAADPRVAMPVLYAPPFGMWSPAIAKEFDDRPEDLLTAVVDAATRQMREAGLVATPVVRDGDPKQVLLREADQFGADCIFLGAKGHSRLERFLLGSVSSAVAARARCSVEVIRRP